MSLDVSNLSLSSAATGLQASGLAAASQVDGLEESIFDNSSSDACDECVEAYKYYIDNTDTASASSKWEAEESSHGEVDRTCIEKDSDGNIVYYTYYEDGSYMVQEGGGLFNGLFGGKDDAKKMYDEDGNLIAEFETSGSVLLGTYSETTIQYDDDGYYVETTTTPNFDPVIYYAESQEVEESLVSTDSTASTTETKYYDSDGNEISRAEYLAHKSLLSDDNAKFRFALLDADHTVLLNTGDDTEGIQGAATGATGIITTANEAVKELETEESEYTYTE